MLLLGGTSVFASRRQILLNDDWQFRFSHHVQRGSAERVDLPHTWNAQDALSGKQDYFRGMGNYEKRFLSLPVGRANDSIFALKE